MPDDFNISLFLANGVWYKYELFLYSNLKFDTASSEKKKKSIMQLAKKPNYMMPERDKARICFCLSSSKIEMCHIWYPSLVEK